MSFIFFTLCLLTLSYAVLLFIVSNSIGHLFPERTKEDDNDESITIIIAVRNEGDNIKPLVQSIFNNSIPRHQYELIIVDDHSTDNTVQNASSFESVKVLSLPVGLYGKKQAITYGIKHASFDNILLTDGDCTVGEDWISMHLQGLQKNVMNTGIVHIAENNSFVSSFQAMDVAATMTATKWGIEQQLFPLANGANLSYKKSVFLSHNQFDDNIHVPSGDDIFMAEKIFLTQPQKLGFISHPAAAVTTKAESNWSSLLQQRIRWASKQTMTQSKRVLLLQIFIGTYLTLMLTCFIFAILHPPLLPWYVLIVAVKASIDYAHLRSYRNVYKTPSLSYFIPGFFLFPIFYIYLGIMAFTRKKIVWKGRA